MQITANGFNSTRLNVCCLVKVKTSRLLHLFTLDDVSVMFALDNKDVLALMDVLYADITLYPNG